MKEKNLLDGFGRLKRIFPFGGEEAAENRMTPADRVYQEVLRQIVAGELTAGERLPTEPLAERMGCSRMPVREALQRLASEGIVILVPGSGARLISPTPREIRDVYAVRALLEGMAVRLAFQWRSPLFFASLEEILSRQIEAKERSYEEYLRQDLAFHRTIAEWGENVFLASAVENALGASSVYRMLFETQRGWGALPSPEEEHREILEALREEQEFRAVSLMECHVLRGVEDLGLQEEGEKAAFREFRNS